MSARRRLCAFALALALDLFCGQGTAVAAPPPMADPSAMSGIPRPDPSLGAGTITVRCLGIGGFSEPAVELEVELIITAPGGQTTRVTATTQEQGRATFTGLGEFTGGSAVAQAKLGATTVRSRPIRLLPNVGTAVLLVEGAEPSAGSPAGPAASPTMPSPGHAFVLDGSPVGSLTVGAFDLQVRKPLEAVSVKLTVSPREGSPIVRERVTDARGKAVFEKLLPPDVPAGSSLVVEATLVEGGIPRRSHAFQMNPERGMAVVLAEGAQDLQAPSTRHSGSAKRPALPGPRVLRTLPPRNVQVTLRDADDAPIAEQPVAVVKRTAAGGTDRYRATTGPDGVALVEGVEVQQDALYFVESVYSRAPYQSAFFGMDARGGIAVTLRLFETTSDPRVVRSAVQFDIAERENDLAQIIQAYEVMVDGEKAFWDPNLKISAMDGAKGFVVLRPAETALDHQEKAPFATLNAPIPPGELTNLSVGYLLEHDGQVDMAWAPPFPLIQGSVLVSPNLQLEAAGAEPSDHSSPVPNKAVYTLAGEADAGEVLAFSMRGLRHRDTTFERIGWWGLGAFGLVTLVGLIRPRPTRKQQLEAQREQLLRELEASPAGHNEALLADLDRVVRQLEVLSKPAGT